MDHPIDYRTHDVVDEVRRYFPHRMFGIVVPRSVRLAEAPSYGQAIVEYDPSSRGAETKPDTRAT